MVPVNRIVISVALRRGKFCQITVIRIQMKTICCPLSYSLATNAGIYIPGVAILHGLEIVRVSLIGSDGTLSHTIDPVSLVCMELAYAVPVNGSSIGLKTISDMDSDIVTPASFNQRPWKSIVEDSCAKLVVTVRRDCIIGDLEPIFSLDTWWPLDLVVSVNTRFTSIRVFVLSDFIFQPTRIG